MRRLAAHKPGPGKLRGESQVFARLVLANILQENVFWNMML